MAPCVACGPCGLAVGDVGARSPGTRARITVGTRRGAAGTAGELRRSDPPTHAAAYAAQVHCAATGQRPVHGPDNSRASRRAGACPSRWTTGPAGVGPAQPADSGEPG